MNYSMVFYILGYILKFESAFLMLPVLVGLIYAENDVIPYLLTAALCLLLGIVFTRRKPASPSLYTREGFVTVALSWIAMSIFGALPFVWSGDIPSYIDALFETISGFTTTGASILTDVEALSRTNLFWRSFTHWIGGMGVLVFVMMLTSLDDENSMHLMRAEVPGPEADKLVPKARDTARILYTMYFILTAAEVIFLMFGGMSFLRCIAAFV